MDLASNVILLILQIVFYRQQELAHGDNSVKLDELMLEPVVDESVLTRFRNHKLIRLYNPDQCGVQLRTLKGIVRDIFELGLPEESADVTVISLANHYYAQRIKELEEKELPQLQMQMRRAVALNMNEVDLDK
ncbi:LAMI_0A02652g1_1 [Lachancea mirantina]|uniref:LAMI_0A02652g1_1 n=1 Tax=Lachancea mirantina TaxID=1230905 RepID=A0A1G4IN71_9SACH|nr:LAMI_0A02652g1_1 [Lachancea mirantina]